MLIGRLASTDATGLPGGVSRWQLRTAGPKNQMIFPADAVARPLPQAAAGQRRFEDMKGGRRE